jgi:hypothetical protein
MATGAVGQRPQVKKENPARWCPMGQVKQGFSPIGQEL